MIRVQLSRLLEDRYLYISILIGLFLTTLQYIENILNVGYKEGIPDTVYLTWLASDGYGKFTGAFLMLLPILASIPYGAKLLTDISTGYYELLISKIKKSKYYLSIYLVTFFSGFITIIIPIIFNFYLHSLTFKAIKPNQMLYYTSFVPNQHTTLFFNLYDKFPLLNSFIYMCLFGLVGGAFAILTLSFGFFIKKQVIVLSIPFIFLLILAILPIELSINPTEFLLTSSTTIVEIGGVLLFFLIIVFVSTLLFILGKREN